MKPVKSIQIQDWMQSKLASAVIEALGEADVMFVGGCVRNALLGAGATDIDMATKYTPDTVMQRLKDAGIETRPTGIDHGTVTAILEKDTIEITTLRKDVETNGRRAVVAFAETWEEDAQRRDFTLNTLLANGKGEVFDPTGQGLEDLEQRKIRFVGEPSQRIAEDVLRILRFFRFFAQYGEGEPDAQALKACAAAADKIPELSAERITQEFTKLLMVKESALTLKLMFDHGVMKDFDFNALEGLKALCHFQNQYELEHLPTRLFALAGLDEKNFETIKKTLLLPKIVLKDIKGVKAVLTRCAFENEKQVKIAVYKYGRTTTAQALMVALSKDEVNNKTASAYLDIIQNWEIPTFPTTGDDLIAQGFKPGPELGVELERLEEEWVEASF